MLDPIKLRKITKRLRGLPGAVIFLEKIRKHYIGEEITAKISDFDNDIIITLSLSEHMSSQIFWYGSYSRDILYILDKIIKPGMVFLDIGANIGEISLFAAKRVGSKGKVISFEPFKQLSRVLKKNLEINNFTQGTVIEKGLLDEMCVLPVFNSKKPFSDGTQHDGLISIYKSHVRNQEVDQIEVTTLDRFVDTNNLEQVDIIKIDIEGSELAALRGGLVTLRRFKPVLIIEVQEETSLAAGYKQGDILEILEPIGYRFERIGRKGKRIPISKDKLKSFQNIVCLPK